MVQCFQNLLLEVLFRTVAESSLAQDTFAFAVIEEILRDAGKFDDAGELVPIFVWHHQMVTLGVGSASLPQHLVACLIGQIDEHHVLVRQLLLHGRHFLDAILARAAPGRPKVDENHLAMVIADVSGKGIPAALFMMATKILISDRTIMGGTPAEILEFVNNRICANNPAEMFVTVWLGILDINTGEMIAANAGHEYPVLCHKGEKFEVIKDDHSFVIGGMENMKYKNYEFKLQKGDRLFVYTDGIPEAINSDEEQFGVERMTDALNLDPTVEPMEVLANVRKEVNDFVDGAVQFDDLTMLCLKYNGVE